MTTNTLRKAVAAALGTLAGIALLALPCRAQNNVDGDVRAGVHTEADAMAIGGGLLMRVESGNSWFFNPNVEVAVQESDNDVSLNGDFHYDFPTSSSVSPYLGGGPALLIRNSNNDVGINLLGGIAGKHGEIRPFGQLKGTLSDNDEVSLMGGIRF